MSTLRENLKLLREFFNDCEFSDLVDMHLISIALVSESGSDFYSEVPFDEFTCNSFVTETVISLLARSGNSLCASTEDLQSRLDFWLSQFEGKITIFYDYFGDIALFMELFSNQLPVHIDCINIRGKIKKTKHEEYFNKSDEQKQHALSDARANKYSYEPNAYFS